jgi:hypothetical protein
MKDCFGSRVLVRSSATLDGLRTAKTGRWKAGIECRLADTRLVG